MYKRFLCPSGSKRKSPKRFCSGDFEVFMGSYWAMLLLEILCIRVSRR